MDKKLAQSIGTAARLARKTLGLTQEDAAERLNVSVEFYARIERGNSLPSVPTFARIAATLGVSADTLLGQKPQESSVPPAWLQPALPTEPPEIRRLLRMLRKATPATLRLVSLLLREIEKHGVSEGGHDGSEAQERSNDDDV
jgi:transcriptional regulator with XRE-family HTH domain